MPYSSIINAVIGTAGSVAGTIGSAQQQKKHDKQMGSLIGEQESSIQNMFDDEYNRDFLDTEVAKGALKRITENYQDQIKRGEGEMAGASDEAKIANRDTANASFNQSLSDLTGLGTQYRSNMRQGYQNQMAQLFGTKIQQQQSSNAAAQQSWANLSQNSADMGANLTSLFG